MAMRLLTGHRVGLGLPVLPATRVSCRLTPSAGYVSEGHLDNGVSTPLARVVIDGLTVSTMLTLVLTPTLYVVLEECFPRRGPAREGAPALQGDMA